MTATYLRKGQGKSDNAYSAEFQGKYPLTIAVKKVSVAIRPFYKISQRIIREWLEYMGHCEWHHVGKYAVICYYYDTTDILDILFGYYDALDWVGFPGGL